jgi:hypothetical protein
MCIVSEYTAHVIKLKYSIIKSFALQGMRSSIDFVSVVTPESMSTTDIILHNHQIDFQWFRHFCFSRPRFVRICFSSKSA